MTTEHIDLNRFIVDRLDASYLWIERLRDGITDEQFYYQPSADSNSIAWLVWHLSRWRDRTSAIVSGEIQIWTSEGMTGLRDPAILSPHLNQHPRRAGGLQKRGAMHGATKACLLP